jgi:hypothetical protein
VMGQFSCCWVYELCYALKVEALYLSGSFVFEWKHGCHHCTILDLCRKYSE